MQEMMIGNTKIIINDMYCRDQTAEQRAKVLQHVSDIAYGALIRQMSEKGKGK